MMHESLARQKHRSGYSCASSVYLSFSDVNQNMGTPPVPRAEGGKCGAVLAAEKVLRDTGHDFTAQFESEFLKHFCSLKCNELTESGRSCNDCVGIAASIIDSLI